MSPERQPEPSLRTCNPPRNQAQFTRRHQGIKHRQGGRAPTTGVASGARSDDERSAGATPRRPGQIPNKSAPRTHRYQDEYTVRNQNESATQSQHHPWCCGHGFGSWGSRITQEAHKEAGKSAKVCEAGYLWVHMCNTCA